LLKLPPVTPPPTPSQKGKKKAETPPKTAAPTSPDCLKWLEAAGVNTELPGVADFCSPQVLFAFSEVFSEIDLDKASEKPATTLMVNVLKAVNGEPFKNLVVSTCSSAEAAVLAVADAYNHGQFSPPDEQKKENAKKLKPLLTYDRLHKAKKDVATLELALGDLGTNGWSTLLAKDTTLQQKAPAELNAVLSAFERYQRCIGIADRVIFAGKGANMIEEAKDKAKETAIKIALQAVSIAGSVAAPFTGGLSSVAATTVTETIESVRETMEQMEKMRNLKSPEEQREVASEAFTDLVEEQQKETKKARHALVDLSAPAPEEKEKKATKAEVVPLIYQQVITPGVQTTKDKKLPKCQMDHLFDVDYVQQLELGAKALSMAFDMLACGELPEGYSLFREHFTVEPGSVAESKVSAYLTMIDSVPGGKMLDAMQVVLKLAAGLASSAAEINEAQEDYKKDA